LGRAVLTIIDEQLTAINAASSRAQNPHPQTRKRALE
jgi:hypothetical protein